MTDAQLTDVMEQCYSSAHQLRLRLGENRHRVVKYVMFMMHVLRHSNHLLELGGYILKQSKFVHLTECRAGVFRDQYLINFVTHTFTRYMFEPSGILFYVDFRLG